MTRIASFNVENLFARPKAFRTPGWTTGRPVLAAYKEVNELFQQGTYSAADKRRIRELLVRLDIYALNEHGAARRKYTSSPKWAWLRKNRGSFDREPRDATVDVEIIADGRDSWIGWVELAVEPTDETTIRMTARVIEDVDADIVGVVEAEDRPSLVRFNEELLGGTYEHVMLVDGNDDRGIDVGLMTKRNHPIHWIQSHVDARDSNGEIFSRDCPVYEVETASGEFVYILLNHFKSQSGGGHEKRRRQALRVRKIAEDLIDQDAFVVVMGDLNEGPATEGSQAESLRRLFQYGSPLVDCYSLDGFDLGGRPGTYGSCGIRNRLDYILISENLTDYFLEGGIFRKGLWGKRKSRPDKWDTYPEMQSSDDQASDHAAVWIELDL